MVVPRRRRAAGSSTRTRGDARGELIAFCRRLPHATEDIKWEKNLVFSVGKKMFAVFNATGEDGVSFKAAQATFKALTKISGIAPAPYLARHHWVALEKAATLPRAALKELIRESYELVSAKLPAGVRKRLGLHGER
jgi:predicted DNA-binding protein (MmcQ/YjbR family)